MQDHDFSESSRRRFLKGILATGAFNVSNGAGDLFNYKRADFEYNGVVGPALTVLADNGAVL